MSTVNYAIHLNGTSQYANRAHHANFDYATGNAFTMGLVFRPDYGYETLAAQQYLWHRYGQHSCYIESGEIIYYINGATAAVTWRTGVRVNAQHTHFLVITGAESTDTTLKLYLDGTLRATYAMTGGLPADTNTVFYVGCHYTGSTASLFFKGNICSWFQSNTTAITAANVLTQYHGGVYDIDVTEAITGLVDSVGFEEAMTGTTYDNALSAGIDLAGQGTPIWVNTVNPMGRTDYNGFNSQFPNFTSYGAGQSFYGTLVIQSIQLVGPTGTASLTDWNGGVFYTETAAGIKYFSPPKIVQGIKVPAGLTAGTLYLEFA